MMACKSASVFRDFPHVKHDPDGHLEVVKVAPSAQAKTPCRVAKADEFFDELTLKTHLEEVGSGGLERCKNRRLSSSRGRPTKALEKCGINHNSGNPAR